MRKVVILVYAGSNPAIGTETFTNDERSTTLNKKGGLGMYDETDIEIVEDEIWVNGKKARIEPGSLFIENDDDVNKPLRVSATFLPDSLTIRREQKPPEEKPVIDYNKIPIHAGLHKRSEGEVVGHLQDAVRKEAAEAICEPDQPE